MIEARLATRRGSFTLDVALAVPARGVTALFGPSGCGKTTLLRLIAGLDRDPHGMVRIAGMTWQDGDRFVPVHRRAIGYVFQEPSLFPHLDVRGNLRFGLRRTPRERRRLTLEQAAAMVGAGGLLDRHTADLSGGERRRVAIARTLLSGPRLLLMDEPLAELDAASKADILPCLQQLNDESGVPILYVSHALDEVAQLADHIAVMRNGRIEATGPLIEMTGRLDTPLAELPGAESVLEATLAEHLNDDALSRLDICGRALLVPHVGGAIGRRVRVRVLARDVSLALTRPTDSSILNILPAEVLQLRELSAGQVLVRVQLGEGTTILARVTRRSARVLHLAEGVPVFAQIKSVALLGPERPEAPA